MSLTDDLSARLREVLRAGATFTVSFFIYTRMSEPSDKFPLSNLCVLKTCFPWLSVITDEQNEARLRWLIAELAYGI